MKHPVFFSFAGDALALAERLKSRFADDLVYMYRRTGVDGDSFPTEILTELRQCEVFVVFWSAAYVRNDPRRPWCARELLTAARRIEQKTLRRFLILQVDETPLDTAIVDPETGDSVDALRALREDGRAFTHPLRERSAELRISTELAQLDHSAHPVLPRPDLERQLRVVLATGNAQTKTPVVFVGGFHGSGRRTLIHSVMSLDFRHLTPYTISLDSADSPEDLLRVVWGEVLQKSVREQRLMMQDIQTNPAALARYYSQLGLQLVANKSYLVISKDESTDVSEVVPSWVPELFASIRPAVQPIVFFIVGRSLPQFMQRALEHGGEVSVPTLEDGESVQLVNMMIGSIDPMRTARWKPHIATIVEAAANSPKLLVDIVRVAAKRASLDFIVRDAAAQASRFDERVQRAVEWAWQEVGDDAFAVQVLDVINLLGVAHLDTLGEVFASQSASLGDAVFSLSRVGLVEHLSDSVYRIPRALARKLNILIAAKAPRKESNELLRRFARSVTLSDDEHGGVTLTNRIQVKLSTDTPIAEQDRVFVTASMLFKAGWQRYRLAEYSAALGLLRRSFSLIDRVRDDSTKMEIARFFGLAAAREHNEQDVDAACRFLANGSVFHQRLRDKARAMEFFLRGFALKSDSQFERALDYYGQALDILPEGGFNDLQRSQILNETVQCLLRAEPVDYARAVELSERLCAMRETPNNIDVLLRALLGQTYYDQTATDEVVQRNFVEIDRREAQLRQKCEGSNLSFYAHRVLDRLEAEAVEAVFGADLPYPALDLLSVVDACKDAYSQYGDETLLWRKWDLMLVTEAGRDWTALHKEASSYLLQGSVNRMGRGNAARIRVLTFDLDVPEERRLAYIELDGYRADGTIPRPVAAELKRQLDAGNQSQTRVLGKFIKRGLRIQ